MTTLPAASGAAALVGRHRQFGLLRDRLERASAQRGSAVLLTGEAGVGKSRLVRELAATADEMGTLVLEGRCVAIGSEPLRRAALLELLRANAAGHTTADPSEPSAAATATGLAGASTEELLERVLSLVDAASPSSTVLIVVEDLHWADRATCEVLMVLARHVVGRPACLVMTTRDDELPRGHHVRGFLAELARAQLATSIPLPRLGAAEVAALIQSLVGPVEPTTAAAIFERSEGSPLLVEELCVAGAGLGEALDDRLADVLLARAERLSEDALTVARAVSAAGRFIDEGVLVEVLGPEGGPVAGLREALDHHLLVRRGDAIGFRHVLVAEAVHGQLLGSERAAIHARWAEVLSQRGDDPAVLAHHWAEAGDSARALTASLAAGDVAMRALAPLDATAHYRRALVLWSDVSDPAGVTGRNRVEVCVRAAEAANLAGEPGEAVALITLVLDDPMSIPDPVITSRLLERQGWYLLRQGRTDAARSPYQAAVAGLPADAPATDRSRVLAGSVRIWERLRDHEKALETAREAVDASRDASDADEGQARYMLGRALLAVGETDAALAELQAGAASAERCLDPVSMSIALLDQADVLAAQGRLDEALQESLAVAARFRATGHRDPHGLLAIGVASGILHRMGRTDRALALAETLVDEARAPVTLALGHLLVGYIDVDRRAFGDAREHLEMARFLSAPLLDGRIAGNLALGRAELALAEGRHEDARAAIDEGIAQVERTGDDEVLCHLCLLGLRLAADRVAREDARLPARARARDATAVDHYERRLATLVTDRSEPVPLAVEATWRAERLRLDGTPDAATWAEVAERWAAVTWPRHACLARIRQAEALQHRPGSRGEAPTVLGHAVKEAEAIGSSLLSRQAKEVARRAGIVLLGSDAKSLEEPSPVGSGLAPLTRREREVLELVVDGATNRQIGSTLYISAKTASVHVSRILTKLGAHTRQEAAAIARRSLRV